jgi:hypothetical protein
LAPIETLVEAQRRMQEEHRKDQEAFERVKRFFNTNGRLPDSVAHTDSDTDEDPSDTMANTNTIIGQIAHIMESDPTKKWTVPSMLGYLRSQRYPMHAKKPEATIGITLRKLQSRGRIRLVRQGAGRSPSIYKWIVRTQPTEGDSDISPTSERATRGQPALQ